MKHGFSCDTAAFWLDDSTGHFITSNYYMTKLPVWVDALNARNPVKAYMSN